MTNRIEHDPLGKKEVPADAYWGIHTQRAVENFPISGLKFPSSLMRAIAQIKIAAARTNSRLGLLDKRKAQAIVRAGLEVVEGKFSDHFVVDVFQAGAGTPTNMNVNEVIANRAIELLRGKRGDYHVVHPNDHVNMSQSTNDVFPSAMRIAVLDTLPELLEQLDYLEKSLNKKAVEFHLVIKSGRTHLQDAVPITLGQEFEAYAMMISKQVRRLKAKAGDLHKLNLGGTAVGTGINAHPKYRRLVLKELSKLTTLRLEPCENMVEGTQSMADCAAFSGAIRSLVIDLTKICNDLRLLGSGPKTGLGEIALPAVEPGSSIMPGKVNPSMVEMLNMVCFQVMGNDMTIAQAASAGQLELNVMMPVIAHNLLQSIKLLTNGIREFTNHCVKGIKANTIACEYYYEHSLGLATLLSPKIGYDAAADLAKEALTTHKTIRQIVLEKKLLGKKELNQLFNSKNATKPNVTKKR